MILTPKALNQVKEDKALRAELAIAMDATDFTVLRWIKDNKPNGPLTTYKALELIKDKKNMVETDILMCEEKAVA